MNWRWLLWDFADPALPLSRRERFHAWRSLPLRELSAGMRRRRATFAAGVFAFGLLLTVVLLGVIYGYHSARRPVSSGMLIAVMIVLFIANWIWVSWSYGVLCRREQFHCFRLMGYDLCVKCGYWLRGLGDDVKRCPECGAEREPLLEAKKS